MPSLRGSIDTHSLNALQSEQTRLPAWPVLMLFWGYPAFWALGLLAFAQVIVAIPMVAFLILYRRVSLVPGVLPWLLFPCWMAPTVIMVDQLGRLVGLGVRFSQFLSLAIMMIYIVNARHSLSARRILNGLTFVWVFVIIGGYLGMLFPEVRLTYTIGRLLPGFLTSNDYISDLVFPPLAEIQSPWGAAEPFNRPSAPFAYTNGWGAAVAVLTPIAIANAVAHKSARIWVLFAIALAAAVPPAVASTNRGLFLGLALGVAYVVLRLFLWGQWKAVLGLLSITAVVYTFLYSLGFLEQIDARQATVDTTAGRWNLYVETFQRALLSPVLGYGSPRPSFTSEIYVGTQGAVWNALFCFGFVGLFLFLAMIISAAVRTVDPPNSSLLWLHASTVVVCVLAIFYGLDRQLLFSGTAAALMLREKYSSESNYWTPSPRPFRP